MKLKYKLASIFLVIIIIVSAVGHISYYNDIRASEAIDEYEHKTLHRHHIHNLTINLYSEHAIAIRYLTTPDQDIRNELLEEKENLSEVNRESLSQLEEHFTDEESFKLGYISEYFDIMDDIFTDYVEYYGDPHENETAINDPQLNKDMNDNKTILIFELVDCLDMMQIGGGSDDELGFDYIQEQLNQQVNDAKETVKASSSMTSLSIIIGVIIILIVSIFMTIIMTRSISKPIEDITAASKALAMGDMSSEIDGKGSDEIIKMAESFNHMARELKAEINERKNTEIELKDSVNNLKKSNEELESFAHIATHDLREPLRMVSTYVRLISQRYSDKLDADADEFIYYAVNGAENMQRMIDDFWAYTLIRGRERAMTETDLEDVLNISLMNIKSMIDDSGARITHDPLPTIKSDGMQFTHLFQNLISNAIKFCGEDSPIIHISSEDKDDEWIFSVKDNGIGIEKEYQEKIFKIFTRLHSKKEYPGTGIGLSISKSIIDNHGGRIWVESEPGKGSIFFFSIKKVGELNEQTN